MATGTYVNDDGLLVRYGAAHKNDFTYNRARGVVTTGVKNQIIIPFDLALVDSTYLNGITYSEDLDNDGVRDGFTAGDAAIPGGAVVTDAYLVVTEAAAGGTSIVVGTYEVDGTVEDADGIFTTVATAALTDGVVLDRIGTDTGADVGVQVHATDDHYVAIDCTGTFTAGRGFIVVEYIEELAV